MLGNDDFGVLVAQAELKPELPAKEGELLIGAVLDSAEDDYANKQSRAEAVAIGLQWLEEGEFTYDSLESLAYGFVAEEAEDGEILDSVEVEEDEFNDMIQMVGDALMDMGGSQENVTSFINNEDDDAGESLGNRLSTVMDNCDDDDYMVISRYAVGGMVLDSMKRVVRDGEVKWIKKPRRKRRLTAAQRMALKRARKKANTSAAKRKRSKAKKIRKSRGMS